MDKLGIFGNGLETLRAILDRTTFSQKVLSKNIANAEVADYKAERPVFHEELTERTYRLRATHERHIVSSEDRKEYKTEPEGEVNMEDELISLVKTRMNHALTARLATHKIRALRDSINGKR